MKRVATVGLLALTIGAFGAARTSADPILVSGGSGTVMGITGGPFNLVSDVFDLSGGMNWGWDASPYRAGEIASIYAFNSGLDLRSGPGVVNGIFYDRLFYEGFLQFDGSFVVPDVAATQFSLLAPFNLTGFLLACTTSTFTSGCAPANLVFQSPIEGGGVASINMTSFEFPPMGRLLQSRHGDVHLHPNAGAVNAAARDGRRSRDARPPPAPEVAQRAAPSSGTERIRTIELG